MEEEIQEIVDKHMKALANELADMDYKLADIREALRFVPDVLDYFDWWF